jgi:hypothetical protein
VRRRPPILASFRDRARGSFQAWTALLALTLLIGVSVIVAGPFLTQDRAHSQDRFLSVVEPAPAPSSAPADSPRPIASLDLSPVLPLEDAVAPTDPDALWSRVLPARQDGYHPGVRSRIERPPRSFA